MTSDERRKLREWADDMANTASWNGAPMGRYLSILALLDRVEKLEETLRVFGVALEIKGGSLNRDKFLAMIRESLGGDE
jgi:hypothetical protein